MASDEFAQHTRRLRKMIQAETDRRLIRRLRQQREAEKLLREWLKPKKGK
jgi:hypothetical protein